MHNHLFSIGPVTVYGYGLMIAIGALGAIFLTYYRAKKKGLNKDLTFDTCLWGLIAGLVGAKFTYVISNFSDFLREPKSVLTGEGFIVYGGVLLGALVGLLRLKAAKVNVVEYADLIFPQIPLAQGFGRIGCFLAGCCYGKETSPDFGVIFPLDSVAPGGVPLIPTQLYSSAYDFMVFLLLIYLATKKPHPGTIACLYPILFGLGRFIIEFFRGDPRTTVGPLTTNQVVSILLILAGIAVFIFFVKKNRQDAAEEEDLHIER